MGTASPTQRRTNNLCGRLKDERDPISYDAESNAIIKLNNGMVLYMREVNKFLALVCLVREEHFEKHGLIDYNFECFKSAITEVFEVRNKLAAARAAKSSALALANQQL